MKKTVLFLLVSSLAWAQSQDLLNNDWYISKTIYNGQTTNAPAMDVALNPSKFRMATGVPGTEYYFDSKYFNTCQIHLQFIPNSSSFIKKGLGCTLMNYMGSNATAVNNFDNNYQSIFSVTVPGGTLNYEIIDNSSGKTLIITNPDNGNQIYYTNLYLSAKEAIILKKTFSVYPNPVKEDLYVENIQKNLPVRIFDISGKKVYETVSHDKNTKISVRSLPKGQYILTAENYKSVPIIKE